VHRVLASDLRQARCLKKELQVQRRIYTRLAQVHHIVALIAQAHALHAALRFTAHSDRRTDMTTIVNPIQLQKYLKGIDYPVNKQQLIETAKKNGADENVLATLQQVPDKKYDAPVDVSEEVGKLK
jgi:hypothetical protein